MKIGKFNDNKNIGKYTLNEYLIGVINPMTSHFFFSFLLNIRYYETLSSARFFFFFYLGKYYLEYDIERFCTYKGWYFYHDPPIISMHFLWVKLILSLKNRLLILYLKCNPYSTGYTVSNYISINKLSIFTFTLSARITLIYDWIFINYTGLQFSVEARFII